MSEMVPKGWVSKKIKEVSVLTKGLTYASSDYSDKQNGLPFLTLKSISRNGGYSPVGLKFYKGEYREHHSLNIGDILFANTDLTRNGDVVGSPLFFDGFILDKTTLYSMDLSKLNVDPQKTHSKFLYYLLMTHRVKRYMVNSSAGSTVLHLDTSRVKELDLNLPPLPEQKKIASILTSVDEVIEKTQSQINKLQDLKKGMMNVLLTKGIGDTEFKDSELGRIPKSWEVKFLSEVTVKIGDGIHATPKYSDSGNYPFINGNNLVNGKIVIDNSTKKVDVLEFEKQRTDLGDKTLLLSINGTIGNLAFYNLEEVVLGKSTAYLTFLDTINLSYAYYLLGSERIRKYFYDELTGTTIKNLSLKSIRNTPIAVPPFSEQIEVESVISSIDEQINKKKQKLVQTQSLKKSLMQDLLTGKVRVKVN